ncbi:amidohydrolase [Bacillus sp. Marseille-P3661]|uniref:amidohydrolase n=1 Tax=Bacillus sp. Marseille-P3661 TaxID=1936234 RepID=UPI0027E3CA37|nr:amidohydrolase [Bacillus sp. Marseille-P3661]
MEVGTLWYGGTIYTMESEYDTVEAVFVQDGVISATGNLEELNERFQSVITEKVNLKGATMFPGFVDSHLHIIGHGEKLLRLDLSTKRSADEIIDSLNKRVKTTLEGEWLIGEGWNENLLPDQKIFHCTELDEIAPNNPMMLTRVCRHAMVVNTKALELAGIDDNTPDPPGGVIVRDDSGKATGFLLDQAQELIKRVIPTVSKEYLNKTLTASIDHLHSLGLVGGHTEDLNYYGGFNRTFDTYLDVVGNNSRKFRANLLVHHEVVEDMHKAGYIVGEVTPFVELGAMKIFADGALGGRTALLSKPYDDAPDTSGVAIHSINELEKLVQKARDYNMPVAIHVIGDLALEYAIRAIEKYPPKSNQRDRLIHCQVLRNDLLTRMKKLPLIADIQPSFVASDFPWVIDRLGKERVKLSYAWRTLLDEGIICAGGSDAPIEDVNPLLGIYAAVTRKHPEQNHGNNGYFIDQALTVYEAIQLFTIGSAKAINREKNRGLIKEGYIADFTIFEQDLMKTDIEQVLSIEIKMTVVDNSIVYKRE